MKTRLLTQIAGMTLVVMLTLVVAQGLVIGPKAGAEGESGLQGAWLLEAALVDCDTGDPLPIPGNPFPALHTYRRDGTMLDAGAPPLSRRRSRAVPPTASGSARAIGPFACAFASSVLMRQAVTPAPLKSHSTDVL